MEAQGDEDVRRLLAVPGVDVTTAVTLIAVIGDARRFPSSRHLVGYHGLHPRVRQSGSETASAQGRPRNCRPNTLGYSRRRHNGTDSAALMRSTPRPFWAKPGGRLRQAHNAPMIGV